MFSSFFHKWRRKGVILPCQCFICMLQIKKLSDFTRMPFLSFIWNKDFRENCWSGMRNSHGCSSGMSSWVTYFENYSNVNLHIFANYTDIFCCIHIILTLFSALCPYLTWKLSKQNGFYKSKLKVFESYICSSIFKNIL